MLSQQNWLFFLVIGFREVKQETQSDTTLQTVIQWIREGWPTAKPSDNSLSSFWINRDPLQMEQDVLLLV